MSTPTNIRTLDDVPNISTRELVDEWSAARLRSALAIHVDHRSPSPDDLLLELTYGTKIAQDATSGRWCAVAQLLHTGAVHSWSQLGAALGMSSTEARDSFHTWVDNQRQLRHHTRTVGVTDADADNLLALSQAVAW